MPEPQNKTFYLIDGHAQFFRAYYAIRAGMTSPVTHEPTNMTFGFVGMILKLFRDYAPDYLAVAIDVSDDTKTFRSEIYPPYKANREEAPDDFGPQVQRCLQLLQTMRIPVIGVPGVEADDVIASITRRLRDHPSSLALRIVSRDKDLTQALRRGVELFDVHKDESVTPAEIFKTPGVQPRHVVDILSLMGDPVDNIPGVPGIGPKTASKLVLEYGSIENLFANIDRIKGKRRENLQAFKDRLSLNRRLVTLKDDVTFDFDLADAATDVKALPVTELLDIFRQLGFNQHQQTLKTLAGGHAPPTSPQADFADALFEPAPAPVHVADTPQYRSVTAIEQLDELVTRVRDAGECAVDTETDSLSPVRANLCGISIATTPADAVYIPVRSPDQASHLDADTVIRRLRPVLEDHSILIIAHNLKYDLNVLRRHGLDLRRAHNLFDTMVASYVIDATRSSHKLDVLALAVLGHQCIPIENLIGKGKNQIPFDQVPLAEAVPYAAEDALVALRLRDAFAPQLRAMGLLDLFEQVEMPLVPVLAELEYNGIRVDPDELERQRANLGTRIEALRHDIAAASPRPLNPDSPRQLAHLLFNKPDDDPPGLGLKVVKRGKTGPSTDQQVLEKLADDPAVDSPVPSLIIEYRQLTKLVNTYLVALGQAINPQTGRVHASFNQTVAATGRLSSSDPNLQNIPIRTDIGREIRRAFLAEPGNVLITADYSQIELRLLAHLSRDPALIDAFRRGIDIHRAVAAEVFGVTPENVDPRQRGTAKMVNFGIVYGITPFGLARRLGGDVSVTQAGRIIADYKARYAAIDGFLNQCIHDAESTGYVQTILGRRRAIPQIRANNPRQRALGERMAINTVVQGSAADLIKLAMIDLYRQLPSRFPDVRMLLQIHDELVFEAPADQAEDVQHFVVQRMEQARQLDVPLVVDAARSPTWIDAK